MPVFSLVREEFSLLGLDGQEILNQQHQDNMSCASEVESTHTNPQSSESFSGGSLKEQLKLNKLINKMSP